MSDLSPNWEDVLLPRINADIKLLPVFGKAQVMMFELAGIVGKHLS